MYVWHLLIWPMLAYVLIDFWDFACYSLNFRYYIIGCYSPEQKCDFRADCADNTDEKTCPIVYLFDDCVKMTGAPDCGWKEEPKDSLDWKIVNNSIGNQKLWPQSMPME